MIVIFTDEEKKWIEKEPLNWHIKQGCPEQIKKELQRKLKLVTSDDYLSKLTR